MRVALIGATGLIGARVAALLAGHDLHCLQRRPGLASGTVHLAPPEQWPELVRELKPEAAISALGTTMARAGSRKAFRAIDHDIVVEFAEAARAAGATRMISVSSVGSDAGSRNFYLRTKAEMEQALGALGFARLDVFRPGLLCGERGNDRRLGERLGIALSPAVNLLLRGPLDRFAAIDAALVAEAMVATLAAPGRGTHVHHNREIRSLARR